MNADQAALIETDNMRLAGRPNHLKLAERPDRDRIQRVVDLADALLSEAATLARDKAFTDEATKLKPLDILSGINFYDEVQRFETHLIKMALAETGGNQSRAAKLLGIKATTLNSKIKLFNIEVSAQEELVHCLCHTNALSLAGVGDSQSLFLKYSLVGQHLNPV